MLFDKPYGLLSAKNDQTGRGYSVTGYIRHPYIEEIVLCTCTFVTWMDDESQAFEQANVCLKKMSEAIGTLSLAEPLQSIDDVLAEVEAIRKERESKPYQDQ